MTQSLSRIIRNVYSVFLMRIYSPAHIIKFLQTLITILFLGFMTFFGKRSLVRRDRKSTRLNSSHLGKSYAVFCLKKKKVAGTQLEGAERGANRRGDGGVDAADSGTSDRRCGRGQHESPPRVNAGGALEQALG